MFPDMEYVKQASSVSKLIFIPYKHKWKPMAAWKKGNHIQIYKPV